MMGVVVFFFFQAEDGIRDGTVTGVQTCALPIFHGVEPRVVHVHVVGLLPERGLTRARRRERREDRERERLQPHRGMVGAVDRKSTRLNSSHSSISYAVFCLKKKKITT